MSEQPPSSSNTDLPIAGDGKYGGRQAFPEGFAAELMLHAREIAIPHPDDGTTLRVTAPLPPHMEAMWRKLNFDTRKSERALAELLRYAEGLAHSPRGTKPKAKKADRGTGTKPARNRRPRSQAKQSKKSPRKPERGAKRRR